ncbi:MAG: CHASE domain-containing protein [Chloroflexales bacterium]
MVWPIASFMIGLALLAFLLAWNDKNQQLDVRLRADASEVASLIDGTLTENERSLLAVRALFVASHEIERDEFNKFVAPLFDRLPSTQAIAWSPRVLAADRVAFERSVQASGFPDFGLYERDVSGQRAPVAARPEYFPATFVEPFDANREALGFDIGSESSRMQTIIRACDTGLPMFTPPIRLVQPTDEERSLLLITAVYRQGVQTDSIAARRENLLGVIYSRFQMSSLLEKVQTQISPHDIELYLFDLSDDQPQLLIFHPSHSGAQTLPAGATPDLASLKVAPYYSTQFVFGGRTWSIVARPGPAYVAEIRGWDAWSRLLIGLLSAAVFLLYMYTRRRADELLQQSQVSLEMAQAVAHLGSWELDSATGRGFWSKEMFRLFHRDPSDGVPVLDEFLAGVYPKDRAALLAAQSHAVETGEQVIIEYRAGSAPEGVRHFEATLYSLRDAQGQFLRMAGTVLDITERKQAQARLSKLNRTYALLSEINQVIVRVREPQELFDATCSIAVAQGGFRMAWIGRHDPQTRRVRPIAHAGAADGYLENLLIVVDDSPTRDAYLTALRAGEHVVVNDIDADLRIGPWRDAAHRLGYRASAIFPLTVAGELYCALNLYAPEIGFFDQDELKLLDEMAADITFALEFIGQEAQRRLAEEQLRASEAALKQSEARYRVIFEGANEGIIAVRNGDRSFQYANPAICALFGYSHAEFLTLRVNDLHPSEALPQVLAEFEALARAEKTLISGVPCRRKDGRVFYADVKATLARLDGHEFLVGFFNDVTARLRAQAALTEERNLLARRVEERTADLSRANTDLARAVRAKDEFLANMSHELRTPLNAILALSEGLLEQFRGPLNARQQDSIRNIESSGRHLLVLINDILDLSKVESGLMELQPEIVAIADVCEASLLFVKEQAIKKQLRLGVQLSDQLAIVQADPKRLKQMLVNLLSNAVKFTEKGGRVSLAVDTDSDAGVVRFAVEDTGIGMTPEGMAQLFQPFVQLDSSLSRMHDGSGLGLALVRRLAELHGGSVAMASEVGKGSRFTIALPYLPQEREDASLPPALWRTAAGGALRSAFIIEDSAPAGEQLARYLKEVNIHAVIYAHGLGVLEQVASLLPDVILLDLQMPDLSGWEVLAQLKADPLLCEIPVIIVSVVDDRARGMAAGAVEYLVKPISREILRRTLDAVSAPKRAPEALVITAPGEPAPAVGHILLVEDNEINIIAIGDYLQDRGYHVAVARNGREALDMVGEVRPDVILMDIQMPVMDGLEATRHLRAMPAYAATPIIALTALAMPGDRERCLAAGVSEYMAKPVSLRGLVETLQGLLRR